MKMVTGWKMQVLSLKNILISVLFCFILLNVSHAATLKVDTITPKGSASDLTFTRSATGDFVFTDMGTGFLKVSSDVLTSAASFDLTADVTGILPIANGGTGTSSTTFVNAATNITGTLPIANGGTNSSTDLNNNFVMISSGGAIVESSTISTTELGFINGLDQNLATTDSVTFNGVILTSDATFQSPATFESTATFESAATFAELASDASTAPSGYRKIFAKADGFYQIDDAGTVSELGSGGAGGAGGINYIDNNDIETDTTGYSTFDDASAYVDGTGGTASNLTLTRNTTTPLRETGDLKLVQGAADSRYEGFSYDFTIDKGMQGEMLTASFWYDASDANYVDDDIRIFIFDKDNSQIIRVNGEDIKGGKGVHYFQFQAASDADDYRVSFMVNQSNTNGYSIYFDQIAVSPTRLARGAIVTAWESFTPTVNNLGSGSTAVNNAFYRRVGSNLEVKGTIRKDATNGTGAGVVYISIPSGLTMDTNKIEASVVSPNLGDAYDFDVTVANQFSTLSARRYSDTDIALVKNGTVDLITGADVRSYSYISYNYSLPIQGWEAEGTLAEDLGGGDVIVEGAGNGGTSITADTTDLDFTETRDTSASWNGTQFTAPSTDEYIVEGSAYFTTDASRNIKLYVDGTYIKSVSSTITSDLHSFSGTIKLTKGEVLSIRSGQNGGTLSNISTVHHIKINKLATGSQKFETATVAATYTSNNGQPIGTSFTKLIYEDLISDLNGAYSGGTYLIRTSGVYSICARFRGNTATRYDISIYLDGAAYRTNTFNDASLGATASVCIKEYLNKDQYIEVYGKSATGSDTMVADGLFNSFDVARIK